jgi:hypothetical protein
MQSYQLII